MSLGKEEYKNHLSRKEKKKSTPHSEKKMTTLYYSLTTSWK
jgi:hypothetical protein